MISVGNGGISRRVLIAQLAAAATALGEAENPLRTLRTDHPRLILLDNDLTRVRASIKDVAPARKIYVELQREADRMLMAPPVEYKMVGAQLIAQSRRALDRIYTLGLLYRLDHKAAYMDRALKELRTAAAFKDWNPAHIIDTAEMAHAFAIGYDWFYADLSEVDRGWIRDAIVQKALIPGMVGYSSQNGWPSGRFTTNLVSNGGLTIAALAVADEDPGRAMSIVRAAAESVPRALASYGQDGSWVEGPYYWQLATRYSVFYLAGLQSALGLDLGISATPGLSKSGRFRIYFSGPTNKTFNFGDSNEDLTPEPAMFWLARRYAQPVYSWQEQRLAERAADAEPLDLIWYERDAKPPQGATWPLDAVFSSTQIAFFRSSWEDPNALFLAVKGGDNRAPHAHLDLGSFVFDAGGIRWAYDPGPDDGTSAPVPAQPGRPRVISFKTRTETHNTLLVENENQDTRAEAKITRHESTADFAWVQIDLSKGYPGRVKTMTRRIGLAQKQAILIQDMVQADQPVDVSWGMMTEAEITLNGQSAELVKGDWALTAEIRTPRHAVFDIVTLKTGKKLVVRTGDKVTDLALNVVLTPHRAGAVKPKTTVAFPA
jgi:Heparinase II/III-like protein